MNINICPKTGRACEITGCHGCWQVETKPLHNQQELSDEKIYEIARKCKAPWHSHAIEPLRFAREVIKASRGEVK